MNDTRVAGLTVPQERALRFLADGAAILSNETSNRSGKRVVSSRTAQALAGRGLVDCTPYGRLEKARLTLKGHWWLAENPA